MVELAGLKTIAGARVDPMARKVGVATGPCVVGQPGDQKADGDGENNPGLSKGEMVRI